MDKLVFFSLFFFFNECFFCSQLLCKANGPSLATSERADTPLICLFSLAAFSAEVNKAYNIWRYKIESVACVRKNKRRSNHKKRKAGGRHAAFILSFIGRPRCEGEAGARTRGASPGAGSRGVVIAEGSNPQILLPVLLATEQRSDILNSL